MKLFSFENNIKMTATINVFFPLPTCVDESDSPILPKAWPDRNERSYGSNQIQLLPNNSTDLKN
jgi:hypothetical protein